MGGNGICTLELFEEFLLARLSHVCAVLNRQADATCMKLDLGGHLDVRQASTERHAWLGCYRE